MNARLGLVLLQKEREREFVARPRETRSWGGEVVEVGEAFLSVPDLPPDVYARMFPLTDFVRQRLPDSAKMQVLEFAQLYGPGLEDYSASLAAEGRDERQLHPFERGFVALSRRLGFLALLFAPEHERIGDFVTANAMQVVILLRAGIRTLDRSRGFVATVLTEQVDPPEPARGI